MGSWHLLSSGCSLPLAALHVVVVLLMPLVVSRTHLQLLRHISYFAVFKQGLWQCSSVFLTEESPGGFGGIPLGTLMLLHICGCLSVTSVWRPLQIRAPGSWAEHLSFTCSSCLWSYFPAESHRPLTCFHWSTLGSSGVLFRAGAVDNP